MKKQSIRIGLILLTITVLPRLFIDPLIIDDVFIYFRYVENAVNGTGLVFNTGEYVFGVTK